MSATDSGSGPRINYPPGFRARRGLNWGILGLTYASYYMCRYNFRWATPGMTEEFGFDKAQIGSFFSFWSIAYGTGQLVNGLLSDKIGGRSAMTIGAVGTVLVNLMFGFSSFIGTFATFALISLMNGYFQSFGAPGMIKINAAWFNRTERGTFAGIFGLMIQMGQVAINNLAPIILAGFAVGTYIVAEDQWRWLFRIPPIFTAIMAILVALVPRETPEQAGYHGLIHDEVAGQTGGEVRTTLRESFATIFRHPLVWWYAIAYACTGAVRQSSDQFTPLFFKEVLELDLKNKPPAIFWTMTIVPLAAVVGSFISGWVSDRFFKGHRSPVAAFLYFAQTGFVVVASAVVFMDLIGPGPFGIFLGCLFLILISLAVNATHSLVGAAAPMDIGGRKMAGFAAGVIDSFQYYGGAIAVYVTGILMKRFHWEAWYPSMAIFGIIGGFAMLHVIRIQKRMHQDVGA